jgi:hypothetical protein
MYRLVLAAIAIAGAYLGQQYVSAALERGDQWWTIQNETAKLNQGWSEFEKFRNDMDQSLADLADDDISLSEAIEQIVESSREHHPDYLVKMRQRSGAGSVKEQIAQNILGHFGSDLAQGANGATQRLVQRLTATAAAMFPARVRTTFLADE